MLELRISPQAQAELDGIWLYIAQDNPPAADRMIDRIGLRFKKLATFPLAGEACDCIAPNLRRSVVYPYVIYFLPQSTCIEIVRVLHGARDIESSW